jgi:hypothetical protein
LPWGNCNHTAANFVATWLHWLKREWFESFQTGCLHCPVSLATHLARRFSFRCVRLPCAICCSLPWCQVCNESPCPKFHSCIGSPARSFLSHQIDFIHKLNKINKSTMRWRSCRHLRHKWMLSFAFFPVDREVLLSHHDVLSKIRCGGCAKVMGGFSQVSGK